MSTIYQKIAAKTLAKKMDQDVVNASSGNKQDLTSQAMGAASSAMYKPAVAKNKGHDGDDKAGHSHTEVFENSNDGTNMGSTSVTTTPGVEGQEGSFSGTLAGDDYYTTGAMGKEFAGSKGKAWLKNNPGGTIKDYEKSKINQNASAGNTDFKPEVKAVDQKIEAKFNPYNQSNPGESTTVSNTESTAEKPMLYNNDAYSVRTNQKGIDIADKKQLKKLKKLEKKRDGKGLFSFLGGKNKKFLGISTEKSSEQAGVKGDERSAYNKAVDAQIASVEAGSVPTEARNNIFKTGLFNRGTGGKSQPGTPGTSETKSTTTSTPPTSGLVDYNAGDETSGTYDAATGSFTVNEGKSNTIKENKASSSMDASTANFKPSKISNNKSFKMNGMKFKG